MSPKPGPRASRDGAVRAVKKAVTGPPPAAIDADGQQVVLGTSRTTPAVASTLLIDAPPAPEESGR